MAKQMRVWACTKKKAGYVRSYGSYNIYKGDRHFILTPVNGGKTRRYESHEAAKRDGWYLL